MTMSVAMAFISTPYLDLSIVCVSAFLSSIYAEYIGKGSILSLLLIRCTSLISPQKFSTQQVHWVHLCAGCFTGVLSRGVSRSNPKGL